MTLEEKAKEYALKALESEIDKVQKAYIDGYNAAKADNHEPVIDENGITWYDMDLPSGNLWSEPLTKDYGYIWLTYNKAKLYELPIKEDWDELIKYTKFAINGRNLTFLSVDGIRLSFSKDADYWLKSEVVNNEALTISNGNVVNNHFIGEDAAIILVKHKQQ